MFNFLIAQSSNSMPGGSGGGTTEMIINGVILAICLLTVIGGWRWFSKAGQPGWGLLVPFYNMFLMCKIAGRPGWWVILLLIPVVNFIIAIILCIDIAKNFGKGALYGLGIAFLPFPFWCMLGFGRAQYGGGSGSMGGGADTGQMAAAA